MSFAIYSWAAVTVGTLLWAQCDRKCSTEEWIRIVFFSAIWIVLIPGSLLWLVLEQSNINVKEKFETVISKLKVRFN